METNCSIKVLKSIIISKPDQQVSLATEGILKNRWCKTW